MNEEQDHQQGSHGSDGVNEQQDLRPTDQHHSRIASVQLRLMLLLLLLLMMMMMMMMMMIQHNPCHWYIRRPYLQNTWTYAAASMLLLLLLQ